MKDSILNSVKQLLLIVFSVVLGIFLSERIEESKNEKEAVLLLSKIKSEIRSNKKILDYWVPHHIEIVHRLDSLSNDEVFINKFIDDETHLFEKVLTRGSLMTDTPSSEAWDIAKAHPLVVHFEYEDLLALSKVYNQQEITYESVPKIIDILLSVDFNKKEKAKLNLNAFKNRVREVTTREVQLMGYLKEAEETLDLQGD